ncbi:hypothetical protein CB1_000813011 [Camelus ferus]|nr:hypothetical protein CB1_000813011 [Camelus ferus]
MADGGGSSSSSGSWWTSLTSSRKKSKYTLGAAQPSAQPAPGEPAPSGPDWTSGSQENQHPNLLGGAGEPHRPDKMCEEKSGNSRRNLKISRSGRFKEKRKVRATLLPEGVRSSEEAGSPGDPHDSGDLTWDNFGRGDDVGTLRQAFSPQQALFLCPLNPFDFSRYTRPLPENHYAFIAELERPISSHH